MSEEMVRHLRRKVTLAAMLAVALAIAALIFVINYANRAQVFERLRSVIQEIAEFEDEQRDAEMARVQEMASTALPDTLPPADLAQGEGPMRGPYGRRSARVQYASRFFIVDVGEDADVRVRTKGTDTLSDDDATALAKTALEGGEDSGLIEDYLFEVRSDDWGQTVVFLDCTTDTQALQQLMQVSLTVGVAAFACASVLVFRLSGLAIAPLIESARKQKRFVTDAGHELKTPLAVITTNMDILGLDLADQPDELEWVDSTMRQVTQMRRLVADLIALSKMEEGTDQLALTNVSLTDVVDECVLTFGAVARAQGKKIVSDVAEGVRVRADESQVRQLVQILLDNACKYATGDGIIDVTLSRASRGRATLSVANDWDHSLADDDLHTLFDRFVRGDAARDRSGEAGGYGLGLSIARSIAERNRIRLDVRTDEQDRIVFRASFQASRSRTTAGGTTIRKEDI